MTNEKVIKTGSFKKLVLALSILTFAIILLSAVPMVSAVTIDTYYTITFDGVDIVPDVNDDGVPDYKWKYNVTCSSDAENAIDYWIIAFCGGSPFDASHSMWYGADASGTFVYGIRFLHTVNKGETVPFWFILVKDYPQGEVLVAVKAGGLFYAGYPDPLPIVEGPLPLYVNYDVDVVIESTGGAPTPPELPFRMRANATVTGIDYLGIDKVVFRWYGPFTGDPGYDETKFKLETTCTCPPFGSYYPGPTEFLEETDRGNWYVGARFYIHTGSGPLEGDYAKGYASSTEDAYEIPWFTSLTMTLLVTVVAAGAFKVFLRKKGVDAKGRLIPKLLFTNHERMFDAYQSCSR